MQRSEHNFPPRLFSASFESSGSALFRNGSRSEGSGRVRRAVAISGVSNVESMFVNRECLSMAVRSAQMIDTMFPVR